MAAGRESWFDNMLPRFSIHDAANSVSAHVELASQFNLWSEECFFSNLSNCLVRQSRKAIGFAGHVYVAFLRNTVQCIVGVVSREKMVRVAARRIVALVKNDDTGLDRSVDFFPDGAGGQFPTAEPAAPICRFILSDPRPALIRSAFVNARPNLIVPCSPSACSTQFTLKGFLSSAGWTSKVWLEQLLNYSAFAQQGESFGCL
jgi:hypothetical protein